MARNHVIGWYRLHGTRQWLFMDTARARHGARTFLTSRDASIQSNVHCMSSFRNSCFHPGFGLGIMGQAGCGGNPGVCSVPDCGHVGI